MRLLRALALLAILVAIGLVVIGRGQHRGPGVVADARVPPAVVTARAEAQRVVAPESRRVLFGDLHVHTTFSTDAFVTALPLMGGEGAHPPADACDYARFCAGLDFWSVNDHAEGLTPEHWQETVDSIRQCNAVAGEGSAASTVAFLGWEWSQVGATPDTHYGHKNVILRGTQDAEIPARPIAAPRPEFAGMVPTSGRLLLPLVYFGKRQQYLDFFLYSDELEARVDCPEGVPTRELPADCHEVAKDPAELFAKLDAWDVDSLVIPHGTSWGLMTPPGASWSFQSAPEQRHPRQSLIEVYSGHGNSEELRAWRAVEGGVGGEPVCPAPTPGYEPCCWRAGEIIRARCEDATSLACEAVVEQARRDHAASGVAANRSVPGASVEDWAGCGQCEDCFVPSYAHRPGLSAQAALASGNFRFGLIGSSDTHAARAGNGFKEHARRQLTEARAPLGRMGRRVMQDDREPVASSEPVDVGSLPLQARRYTERGNSMLLTGGLAAVHASGRGRDEIWQALERKEVYATSGDRILLWFDLLNGPSGVTPMGAELAGFEGVPRFKARAVGAFEQQPGCPAHVHSALSSEQVQRLCLGECFHPSERRREITRIEVVKIHPGGAGSDLMSRVQDPWRVFPCEGSAVCQVEFEDPDYAGDRREAAYYARAIQAPTPAVNGGGLRCERDDEGRCVRVRPCYGDERTPLDDDCLAEIEERAWSSPIFLAP
jgi:hypothetical protein